MLQLIPEIFKLYVGMYNDFILVLDTYDLVETLACFRIPRTGVRRTGTGTSQEVMEVAAAEVIFNGLYAVISEKIQPITTAVRTSNPTHFYSFEKWKLVKIW
jgi:hypothetical protein